MAVTFKVSPVREAADDAWFPYPPDLTIALILKQHVEACACSSVNDRVDP